MKGFVTVPFLFAGQHPMRLTLYAEHLLTRWKERGEQDFSDAEACARYTAEFFKDERLAILLDWAPRRTAIALVNEPADFIFFFVIGTKVDADEIKVSTILPYVSGGKALVDAGDLCYVLPKEGKLRFGKERKYFQLKKRRS